MTLFDTPTQAAPAGIAVTDFPELGEVQLTFLESAGLMDVAPLEAWTVNGSNQQMGYSTHGIYRYFGKFPPPVAQRLIHLYSNPGALILDPMCGSGTSGVEAVLSSRRAHLADVNPVSTLLSRVKTTHIPRDLTEPAITRVAKHARRTSNPEVRPVGLRNPDHWFLPETARSLGGLREAIDSEPEGAVRDFLYLCFAAIVRRVSRATTQQGRLFLDVKTALHDAVPTFEQQALKAAVAVDAFPEAAQVDVVSDNILSSAHGRQVKAPLSIMHPPYFNMYRYSSVNSLEMAWLGMDVRSVRLREIREFFKVGKPDNVHRYLDDMKTGLENGCADVQSGGVVALMIGDTTIGGQHIRVVRPLLETLPTGMSVERIIVRIPKYTEATWAASQRRKGGTLGVRLFDLIVILRKA